MAKTTTLGAPAEGAQAGVRREGPVVPVKAGDGCWRLRRGDVFDLVESLKGAKRLVLLNAVVPPESGMMAVTAVEPADVAALAAEARRLRLPVASYVGHSSTAAALAELTGFPVAVNRASYMPEPGDLGIAARLKNRPRTAADIEVRGPEDLKYYVVWYL